MEKPWKKRMAERRKKEIAHKNKVRNDLLARGYEEDQKWVIRGCNPAGQVFTPKTHKLIKKVVHKKARRIKDIHPDYYNYMYSMIYWGLT